MTATRIAVARTARTGLALLVGQGYRLSTTMSSIMNSFFMVLAMQDTFARQLFTKRATLAITLFAPPFLHCSKHHSTHVTRTISAIVTQCRVVENTSYYSIQSSCDVDILVIPAFHDLRDGPLDDLRGYAPCWLIEDIRKMVL